MVSIETKRNYHRKWREQHPDKYYESYKKWRDNNTERSRAVRMAQRYVPLGKKCEDCGSAKKLQRHHFDYSKPLEVVTLCIDCHKKLHRKDEVEPYNDKRFPKQEIRYFDKDVRVEVLVRGRIPGVDDHRLWRVKRLDTGEVFDIYPARLKLYPHQFYVDRLKNKKQT